MKRLLVALIISLVLLSTSVTGCGQVYLKTDLDAARQAAGEAGYSEGYASGKAEGYDAGHNKGYEAGKIDGYATGYKAGYDTGKAQGYDTGLLEGNKVGYAEGYEAGIIELEAAKQEAEKLGYDKGYEAGIAMGRQEAAREAREAAEAAREAAMARLEDLAYIGALVDNYSDDADPEPEGIWLMIFFYDSKSKLITFKDIPLIASIKLYDLELYPPSHPSREFMYQDTVTIDHTVGLGAEIRIPFKGLKNYFHTSSDHTVEVQVTVATPNQGDFSVTETGWPVKLLW